MKKLIEEMQKQIKEGRISFSGHIDLENKDESGQEGPIKGTLKKPIAVKANK